MTVELTDYSTFSLTLTSNLTFLITLDVVFKLPLVPYFISMVIILKSSVRRHSSLSSNLNDIETLRKRIPAQAALVTRYTVKDLA